MKPSTLMPIIYGMGINRATGFPIRSDPLEDVDIEKEFNLICAKKSHLSASMRRLVARRYEMGTKNAK